MSDLIGAAEQWWLARSFFLLLPFVAVMFRNLSPAGRLPLFLPYSPFAARADPSAQKSKLFDKVSAAAATDPSITHSAQRAPAGRQTVWQVSAVGPSVSVGLIDQG